MIKSQNYKSSADKGFTIVELLVVIVVIGILASVIIVSYSGISKQAKVASLKSDLVSSVRLLKLHQTDYGQYPSTINCSIAESSDNKCLKLSSNNEVDQYIPTAQTFTLKLKNGPIKYAISDNSQPGEVVTLASIAAISGTAQRGQTLTPGSLTPSGATATYQWQICNTANVSTCVNIAGATNTTYKPTAGDVGKYIRVIANGLGFTDGSATSVLTAAIAQAPTTTINGSSPVNGGVWGFNAYWDDGLDGSSSATSSVFNLGSYAASAGVITDASINWNNAYSSSGFGGVGRFIRLSSPYTTLCSLSESGAPTSCSGSVLTDAVNSKRGTTFQVNWEAGYTGPGGSSMGVIDWSDSVQSPRLVFIWEAN